MTKIPPEHTAAKSLEHSFRALGEERSRARGPAPHRRVTRVVVPAAISVLAVAGVATATKVLDGDGDAVPSDRQGLRGLQGRVEPDPGYRTVAQAASADPAGGRRWGMRVFRSAAGETCLAVGRVAGDRLGVVRNGQFSELPTRTAGACGPLERDHVVLGDRNYADADVPGGRTILFGAVDRTITAVAVRAGGVSTPLRVGADGTFILVRKGLGALHGGQLVFDGPGGHRVLALGR